MRKVLMGLVWAAVFYFGSFFVMGFFVGFGVGMKHKDRRAARADAAAEGRRFVRDYAAYVLGGSVALGLAGAFAGVLPGTSSRRPVCGNCGACGRCRI